MEEEENDARQDLINEIMLDVEMGMMDYINENQIEFISYCAHGTINDVKKIYNELTEDQSDDEKKSLITFNNNLPLMYACQYGNYDVGKWLINQGADIHANDDSCLVYSCFGDKKNMIDLCLENGLEFSSQNYKSFVWLAMNGSDYIDKIDMGLVPEKTLTSAINQAVINDHIGTIKKIGKYINNVDEVFKNCIQLNNENSKNPMIDNLCNKFIDIKNASD